MQGHFSGPCTLSGLVGTEGATERGHSAPHSENDADLLLIAPWRPAGRIAAVETALVSMAGGALVVAVSAFAYTSTEFRKEMVSAIGNPRGDIDAKFGTVADEFKALRSDIDTKFGTVADEFKALRSDIAGVRETQAAHGEQLVAIQATLADHTTQLGEIRAQRADHGERMARLEGAAQAVPADA